MIQIWVKPPSIGAASVATSPRSISAAASARRLFISESASTKRHAGEDFLFQDVHVQNRSVKRVFTMSASSFTRSLVALLLFVGAAAAFKGAAFIVCERLLQ